MTKKGIILFSGILIGCILFFGSAVYAIDLGSGLMRQAAGQAGYDESTNETTLAANIGFIVRIILSVVGVLFTLLMVYAGYLWMTARGAEEQIDKAKDIIKSSIIGIIITLGAYSITAFIVPRLVERTTNTPTGGESDGGPVLCCKVCEVASELSMFQTSCSYEIVADVGACQALCDDPGNPEAQGCYPSLVTSEEKCINAADSQANSSN